MRPISALPEPHRKTDVNTPAVLVTMLISTISRRPLKMVQQFVSFMKAVLPKLYISDEGRQLIEDFDDEFNEDELTLTQKNVLNGPESKV